MAQVYLANGRQAITNDTGSRSAEPPIGYLDKSGK